MYRTILHRGIQGIFQRQKGFALIRSKQSIISTLKFCEICQSNLPMLPIIRFNSFLIRVGLIRRAPIYEFNICKEWKLYLLYTLATRGTKNLIALEHCSCRYDHPK